MFVGNFEQSHSFSLVDCFSDDFFFGLSSNFTEEQRVSRFIFDYGKSPWRIDESPWRIHVWRNWNIYREWAKLLRSV